ncbi:PKD domain-containing protein [Chitinophaga vietnamensis]|uniref:PKD domain-containing protein n=1 Tax=Chitinophaga vietnamensis TaxID=2593957 RepID=UPI0011774E0B|nr:PKD domain-containing protein [Chitinophaga vietnamensis]
MRYSLYACALFLLCCLPVLVHAQKEGNVWYFGANAGLDFRTSPPTLLLDGKLNTREGVATISDKNGQLLFYTEGTQIWDNTHGVMPNGYGLLGDNSSSQSAIAMPYPGQPGKYFVVTTSGGNGMHWSVVDMSLNGGKGDIVAATKNTQLYNSSMSSEKMMVTRNCNGHDYWLITHTRDDNNYRVFPVTDAGIGVAKAYPVGRVTSSNGWEAVGTLKASPDGRIIVQTIGGANQPTDPSVAELVYFDNQTGIISGLAATLDNLIMPYGAEFSPDGRMLYISCLQGHGIFQYDLGTVSNINNSKFQIASHPTLMYGSLQLAPDGKIYAAAENGFNVPYQYLGVINKPNVQGNGCNFVGDGFNLSPKGTLLGLPTFMGNIFYNPFDLIIADTCQGSNTSFRINNTYGIRSVNWDFGDGSSSTDYAPQHKYTNAGSYQVTLTITRSCGSESQSRTIHIMPVYTTQEQIGLCNGETRTLPDGRVVSAAGTYTVKLKSITGCDSSIVYAVTAGGSKVTENKSFCQGAAYQLPDGRVVSAAGTYTSQFTSWKGCDSTIITQLAEAPRYDRTEVVDACNGNAYTLPDKRVVSASGTYTSRLLSVYGCDSIITTQLTFHPDYHITESKAPCAHSYLLPDGRTVTASGTYNSSLKSIYGCDSIITTQLMLPPADAHINAAFCQGSAYLLPDGRSVSAAGTYSSAFKTWKGCDSIIITQLTEAPRYNRTENIDICNGNAYTLPDGRTANASGTYTSRLVSVYGCDSIITTQLAVHPPYHITENKTPCTRSYQLPDGRIVNTGGAYTSQLKSSYGCDSIITTILTLPPTDTHLYATICDGKVQQLPDGNTATKAGVYTSTLVSFTGCDSIVIMHLSVQYPPLAKLPPDTCVFNGSSTIITPGIGLGAYLWQDGSTSAAYTITKPGTYTVAVSNDCGTTTASTTATACVAELFLPNAFTPNGDGRNDIFRPVNFHGQQVLEFRIFNRWGEEVFYTKENGKGWNGRCNGILQDAGTYLYLLRFIGIDGKEHLMKGPTTLIL